LAPTLAQQRTRSTKILSIEKIDDYQSIDKREVSNIWMIVKDGKHHFAKHRRTYLATKFVNEKGHSPQERKALKKRLLHKWIGK
jgi:hypothetical protein